MDRNESSYSDDELKILAQQLRKPEGDLGREVGRKMNESNEGINRFALRALDVRRHHRVLEIGMGNGHFCSEVLSMAPGVTYVGCDYSADMVEAARALNVKFVSDSRAEFVPGDVVDMPFDDNSFDAVLSVNGVYFWDIDAALTDISRVLKTNGKLVLALRPKRVMELYPFVEHGFNMFSADDLVAVLEKCGFAVTDVQENDEPDRDFGGQMLSIASLVVSANCR